MPPPNALLSNEPLPGVADNPLAPRPTWADAYDFNAPIVADAARTAQTPQFWTDAAGQYANALMMGTTAPGMKGGASLDNPAFAKWFGKSQVVDEAGKPLVVYHGTKGNIEAFSPEKLGSATGANSASQAFFFTDKPHVADTYAENAPNEAVNALARNADQRLSQIRYLLDQEFERSSRIQLARTEGRITDQQYKDQWAGFQKNFTDLRTEQQRVEADYRDYSKPSQFGGNIVPVHLKLENPYVKDFGGKEYRDESFSDILTRARGEGHDGVVFRNAYDAWKMWGGGDYYGDVYAAFDPTQIKSAIGNRGTFSPTDPRITYGAAGLAAGGAAAATQDPR
ncbi:MAG TPA: hypothetical protein VNH21_12350 [Steroidobacteraceae bacterium]|nr:hypothetical protein [Steroidobacteraceae bacterium]